MKKITRCIFCRNEMQPFDGKINICPGCETNRPDRAMRAKKLVARAAKASAAIPASEYPVPGYRKIRHIGGGGMGQVHLVEEERSGKQMALKLMHPDAENDKQYRLFFEREMFLMQQLKHPNLVKLYNCGYDGNRLFIAMEYCRNGNVEDLRRSCGGQLSLHLATSILFQMLDGLDSIHNAENVKVILQDGSETQVVGTVHRDIKPSNILISGRNTSCPEIKIADLGLAKAFETAGRTLESIPLNKNDRIIKGTLPFMSRSQYRNSRYAKPAVDIWSAAASYYYMLTGHLVRELPDEKTQSTLDMMYESAPAPLRRYLPDIPENLANIIDEALNDRPVKEDSLDMIGISGITDRYSPGIKRTHPALALKKAIWEALPSKQQNDVLRILPVFTAETSVKAGIVTGKTPIVNSPGAYPPASNEYTVEAKLGEGGMGRVYRIFHNNWKVHLALKQPKGTSHDIAHIAMFLNECNTWVNLGHHPHIVSCYYVRETNGLFSIFSEYMNGGSLHDWIYGGAGNPPRKLYEGGESQALARILDISIQSARGLLYVHQQNLIHQDVKPANLLLTAEGVVKVADFGIARASVLFSDAGHDNNPSGTPAYCSPEQRDGLPLTRRTDVWSWAVSVLEMFLGGRRWNNGVEAGEECNKNFNKAPRIAIPEKMKNLLRRCFRMNESERPHDFAEIERELLEIYRETTNRDYPRPAPEVAPDNAGSLNNRALSFIELNNPDEAEACWKQALDDMPNHAESLYNHTVYLWKAGRIDDIKAIHRLEAYPSEEKTSWHLSLIHIARGDAENAKEHLAKAEYLFGKTKEIGEMLDRADKMVKDGFDKFLHECKVPPPSLCTRLSPDGKTALSSTRSKGIQLINVPEGSFVRSFVGHTSLVNAMCYSPDGTKFVSAGDDGIKLWDLTAGNCLRTFPGGGEKVRAVCISPDGARIVAGYDKGTVRIWNIDTNDPDHALKNLKKVSALCCGKVNNSTAAVLSGHENGELALWNMNTGECIATFAGHAGAAAVKDVSISRDGTKALSCDKDTVKYWDIPTRRCLRTFDRHQSPIVSVGFLPDGKGIYWDMSGHIVFRSLPKTDDDILQMMLSHMNPTDKAIQNKKRFDTLACDIRRALEDRKIEKALTLLDELADVPNLGRGGAKYREVKREVARYCNRTDFKYSDRTERQIDCNAAAVCLSPDGTMIAAADGNTVRTLDTLSGQFLGKLTCHSARAVNSVCFDNDARHILSGSDDGTIRLWNVKSGECIRTFKGHAGAVASVSFLCDGERFISHGKDDRTIRLWHISKPKSLRKFGKSTHAIEAISLTSDGQFVLSSGKDSAMLWDVNTGLLLRMFEQEQFVCFSPNAQKAVSIDRNEVRIWDISPWQVADTFNNLQTGVASACFVPNSQVIAFRCINGQNNHSIKLLNIDSGEEYDFGNYSEIPRSICFSDDGFKMAAIVEEEIVIYDLDYNLHFPGWSMWDEKALPCLERFKTLYPKWTKEDVDNILMPDLQNSGFGWISRDGVRDKLKEIKSPTPMKDRICPDWKKTVKKQKLLKTLVVTTPAAIVAIATAIILATPGPREPVYVYKDFGSAENHFSQPFWMGDNYDNIPGMNEVAGGFDVTGIMAEIDFEHHEWGGYYFTTPVIDGAITRAATGNDNVGINLSGALKLTFLAKGLEGGECVEFFTAGLGYGEDFTDEFPDSSRKISLGVVKLTTEWTQYEIPLSGHDLSRVAGGFGWVASSRRNAERTAIRFCFDEIRFEFHDEKE